MSAKKRAPTTAGAIVLFVLLSFTCHAQTKQEMRAAAVLFNQYETVAYVRTDFPVDTNAHDAAHVDGLVNLKLPFEELIEAVRGLPPRTVDDLKECYGSVLMGAKDFVPPKGIGAIGSRKAYIGISKGEGQDNINADFRNTHYEMIGGRRVWTWIASSADGSNTIKIYAAQIKNVYFVITDNKQEFDHIANALTTGISLSPLRVFGWEYFSASKYWIFRSIRREGVASPLASGTTNISPDVIALVFTANVEQRKGVLMVLSSDKSMKGAPTVFQASELMPLKPLKPGIWQVTILLSDDTAGFNTLFRIFYSFGFGAIL